MSLIRTAVIIFFVSIFVTACATDEPKEDEPINEEHEQPMEEREQNDHEDENMIDRDQDNENKLPDVEREDDLPGMNEEDDFEEERDDR